MVEERRYSFLELSVQSLARGQFWGLLSRGLAFAAAFIILAKLSVYQFGLYQLALAAVAIIGSFTTGFFDEIVSVDLARSFAQKRIGEGRRLFHEFAGLKLLMAVLAFSVLMAGAEVIARFYDRDIAGLVRIASFLIPIASLRNIQTTFFGTTLSFVTFGVIAIQDGIRILLLLGLLWVDRLGLAEVLLANVAAAGIVLVYTSYFFLREYRRFFRSAAAAAGWPLIKIFREFGFWVSLRYAFMRAYKNVGVWFVGFFLGAEAVAFYAILMNLATAAQTFIPTNIIGGLLPWEVGRPRRLGFIYRRILKYGVWAGLAIAVGVAVLARPLVALLLPKYLPAMGYLEVMAFTLPLYAVYKSQKVFLTALREQKILALRIFAEAVITAVLLVIFLPLVGLWAIIIEYVAAYLYRVTFYTVYLRKAYPALRLKLREFFAFDRDDRAFLARAIGELREPKRWLRPARVDISTLP